MEEWRDGGRGTEAHGPWFALSLPLSLALPLSLPLSLPHPRSPSLPPSLPGGLSLGWACLSLSWHHVRRERRGSGEERGSDSPDSLSLLSVLSGWQAVCLFLLSFRWSEWVYYRGISCLGWRHRQAITRWVRVGRCCGDQPG